ncbi:MAG TPA: mechanosensitive ion channel family protein [Luteimonas sp.]|nr:mechanosensitive ion channel family protein [Luteimonas sp.]
MTRPSILVRLILLLSLLPVSAALADTPVSTALPDTADRTIGQRLDARLEAIDGLHGVHASVIDGVAMLQGEVVTEDQRKLAQVVAEQTRGVAKVENGILLSSRLRDRFGVALQAVSEKLVRLLAATPLLLVAIAIVALAAWLGRVVSRRMNWLRRLHSPNPYMEGLVQRIAQWAILVAGLLVALDLLGATSLVGAVLGSAGVAGLVLGFAFKDIAENYVAGILLSLRRPFSPGDHVVIDRLHEGKVVALTSRSTLLMTLDGNQVALPNALVFKSVVMNYTQNPKRRFDFLMPLDPSSSVGDAQQAGLAALSGVDGVLADPAPYALVGEYLHDKLNIQFLGWVDQRRNSLARVRSEAMRAAKAALDDAGIRRAGVPPGGIHPPAPTAPADTSVDRDIDEQLAEAQRANDAENLLDDAPREARS